MTLPWGPHYVITGPHGHTLGYTMTHPREHPTLRDDKPLPEPVFTKIYDALWHQQVSMSYNLLEIFKWIF